MSNAQRFGGNLMPLLEILGRIPALPVLLPGVEIEAHAIADYLKDRDGPQRRPEQTARVLALAAVLYLDGRLPWPTRQQVADHLGVSLPMLDVVLSQRQRRRDIRIRSKTRPGNIAQRDSVITDRFIEPSEAILAVVRRARL